MKSHFKKYSWAMHINTSFLSRSKSMGVLGDLELYIPFHSKKKYHGTTKSHADIQRENKHFYGNFFLQGIQKYFRKCPEVCKTMSSFEKEYISFVCILCRVQSKKKLLKCLVNYTIKIYSFFITLLSFYAFHF